MNLISALVLGCLVSNPTVCQQVNIQVSPRACGADVTKMFGPMAVNVNGEMQPITLKIKCR